MFRDPSQQAYAIGVGTQSTNYPILESRDPSVNDTQYPIGKFWINQPLKRLWYLDALSNAISPSNPSGALQATWQPISIQSLLASISDTTNTPVFASSSSATPPDNIQLVAGAGISIVANPASNLLTITNIGAGVETFSGNIGGSVGPDLAGNISTAGGTTIYVTGNPGANSLSWDVVTTDHALLVGRGATTPAVPLSVGTTNTVLLGNTGADPSFGQVPNSALVNNSITLSNGNNITVTGSPVALGGTASFNLTGTTNHSLQVGNASGSLTSLGSAINGQLPIGSTGLDPVLSTLTAGTGISITNGAGSITIATNGSSTLNTLTGNTGGAISPTLGNINTIGSGSITVSGSGSTLTTQLTGLTDHAVLVGAGTDTITKIAATANTGAVLQNNSGADPSYSTATYPSTTTINQLLYSSSANTISGLATANNGVLTTNTTGVPAITTLASNGQLIIGSGSGAPSAATLTAGTGISITNGANSISIATTNGAPITGIIPDTHTPPGTSPVVPNGSGNITLEGGATFNTGTEANPIRVSSLAADTIDLQIQLAGSNPGSSTPNNFGVAQFNSNNFSVSAGYVSSNNFTIVAGGGLTGGGSITLGGTLTLTATGAGFGYSDQATSFSASSNAGYFVTGNATATLPASPSNSDIIKFIVDATATLTIQANTGQFIRIGKTVSASAGTAASSGVRGDAIEIVYRSTDTTWLAQTLMGAAWIVT